MVCAVGVQQGARISILPTSFMRSSKTVYLHFIEFRVDYGSTNELFTLASVISTT
jgi:hypothetical protein